MSKYIPQYTITNKILKFVGQIEAAKEVIENSPLVPFWERQFQNQALIRTIHHSTAIEGNELDLAETERIVEGGRVGTGRVRDVQEIINYRDVIGFVSGNKLESLTMGLLLEVHKRLGKKVITDKYLGQIREKSAVVVNSFTGDVIFDAVEPEDIESELEEIFLFDKEQKDTNPMIKAGILHFEIVRIHPFVDLNGRSARTIATWSMYRDGYDINRFFSLEEHYDQDLKRYYDSLDTGHSGDLTGWIEYFIEGVAEELTRIKEKVLKLSLDRKLKTKFGQVALNDRQIAVINYIEENDELKNPDFNLVLPNISDDTILRDLKDLIDKGILVKKGKTKASSYRIASA